MRSCGLSIWASSRKRRLEKLDLSLCPEVLVDIIGSISGSKAAGFWRVRRGRRAGPLRRLLSRRTPRCVRSRRRRGRRRIGGQAAGGVRAQVRQSSEFLRTLASVHREVQKQQNGFLTLFSPSPIAATLTDPANAK